MFVLVSKDDGPSWAASARKAMVRGAATAERPKTPKVVKSDPDSDEQCCT